MTGQAIRPDGGGQRFLDDRYRLIRPIGSGGMSLVWQGFDEVLGRHVAVKQLATSLGTDPQFPRRLLAEARAVAALNHPHITCMYDFGVHRAADGQWTPYLVMELLDGELLSDALRRGPLPWREAVTVCAELASALHAAHDHGIVHRDVTPGNVMLTSTGVKVLDFGIAALIGDKQLEPDGDLFGTAAYLAPERLISGQVTAAVDVYAAGLVLYKCLAGHLPWPAKSVPDMLYAHAHVQPHPLRLLGLPRAVEEACYQCLSREPHHRPSAAELTQVLAREVRRIDVATVHLGPLCRQPISRDGATMTIPLAAPSRRHVRPRRVLVSAAALLSAIALGYLWRSAEAQPAAAQAQELTTVAPCSVAYTITPAPDHLYNAVLTVTNTGQHPLQQWTLQFNAPYGNASRGTRLVTVTSVSTLDAGASFTQTLHGNYADQRPWMPSGFTLNGQRCDATITMDPAAASPAVAVTFGRATIAGKPPGTPKSKKPHGKRPPHVLAS